MPNTFAPRAFEQVVKDRAEQLRIAYDGSRADVKEWHAMVDLLSDEASEAFADHYGKEEAIPYVVDGVDGQLGDPSVSSGE